MKAITKTMFSHFQSWLIQELFEETHTPWQKKISLKSSNDAQPNKKTIQRNVNVLDEFSRPTFHYDVKPFSNNEIDVSEFLTENPEIVVKKVEMDCQTDAFNNRPITPPYIPRKTGVDRSTQVEDVRELFSFDKEVSAMLEMLVAKTLEAALYEVQCEDELANLQSAAEEFEQTISVESTWMKEKQLQDMKEMEAVSERLKALEAARKASLETKRTVASLQLMRQTLAEQQVTQLMDELYKKGRWEHASRAAARRVLLPLVLERCGATLVAQQSAQAVTEELLREAERRFQALHSPQPPRQGQKLLRVLFRRALPSEAVEGADEEGSKPAVSTVQLSYPILPHDTILSLEAKIKRDIYSYKEVATAEDANSSETAASTSKDLLASQLRVGSVSAPLLEAEFNAFVAKYRMITMPIAWDVPLATFFPVREDLTFDMQVDVE
mmetsp:Transcript_8524/g.11874  ORF Transcript_8524/g.11874 Transcript_8524/m.11874 type:complete len:440 (+) Transcript_8524:135-1454(+)